MACIFWYWYLYSGLQYKHVKLNFNPFFNLNTVCQPNCGRNSCTDNLLHWNGKDDLIRRSWNFRWFLRYATCLNWCVVVVVLRHRYIWPVFGSSFLICLSLCWVMISSEVRWIESIWWQSFNQGLIDGQFLHECWVNWCSVYMRKGWNHEFKSLNSDDLYLFNV